MILKFITSDGNVGVVDAKRVGLNKAELIFWDKTGRKEEIPQHRLDQAEVWEDGFEAMIASRRWRR